MTALVTEQQRNVAFWRRQVARLEAELRDHGQQARPARSRAAVEALLAHALRKLRESTEQ
jgi:hypothetical protein